MDNNWYELKRRGYFFIGDSAYSLRSFLMTSYDNAIFHGTADNFNFVNSLSRIVVECAFDELDFDGVFFGGPCNFPGI